MRTARFFLSTSKEAPAEAELVSHKLMLRAGLIKRLGSGLYTWMPLGLRILRKVEAIVREEMNRADRLENGSRRGTVGFAMTSLQRRLASSPEALYQSLHRRRKKLKRRIEEKRFPARLATPTWKDNPLPARNSGCEAFGRRK